MDAIGESEAFLDFQERLSRVAKVDRPVLLVGERGTGKELAAERLHYLSARWEQPLVTLNCATLSPSLLEAELFGHEAGAFTGATERRRGRFEAAQGGTLFLDELGQVPIPVQEKILRVVEYKRFERVGSSQAIEVDVRIIGATNADLKQLAAKGRFKADLLDRLSFEVLFLPPLRHRGEDILLLARQFAARMALELGWKGVPTLSARAEKALLSHWWPGNVRELKNCVERAVYASDGKRIREVVFDPFHNPYEDTGETPSESAVSSGFSYHVGGEPLREGIHRLEQEAVRTALERTGHRQNEAARLLGLNYNQFRGLYRKHGFSGQA